MKTAEVLTHHPLSLSNVALSFNFSTTLLLNQKKEFIKGEMSDERIYKCIYKYIYILKESVY